MTYLLDTDTCIAFLRGSHPRLRQRFLSLTNKDVIVPAPVRGELFYGAARSQNAKGTRQAVDSFLARFASLPFDDAAADAYGHIRAHLVTQGTAIGPNDLLIAAITVTHQLTLVTHNTREFGRVPSLVLTDWMV
ncbi:MAG TPA: type II toxin-antitoxin system VapC family toxin [Chloroflexota bacterium]|nr:type II toxin-antitoxin system VapC family toxin [Chloroflexota bacterium]